MTLPHPNDSLPDAASAPSACRVEQAFQFTLRLAGGVEMLAVLAVVMPTDWMASAHRALRLGEFSTEPLMGYLARTTSLLWAVHGATVWFLAGDIRRYWPVLRFNAWITLGLGMCLLGIDSLAGMPLWWTVAEGPLVIVMGLWFLVAVRHVASRQR